MMKSILTLLVGFLLGVLFATAYQDYKKPAVKKNNELTQINSDLEGMLNEGDSLKAAKRSKARKAGKPAKHEIYFDVRTKKGYVKMHTGMSKDSVIILLGRPNEYSNYGSSETLGYKVKSRIISDLTITLQDGILKQVEQTDPSY